MALLQQTLLLSTLIFFFFFFFFFFSLLSTIIADDAAFMSKFFTALTPTPPGWSQTIPFCNWDGIECDTLNRVTSISLTSLSLTGTLPSDLNSLSQLTSLSLKNNALSGPLPSLANLSMLKTVSLGRNNFTFIPEGCFQALISLVTLNLGNNVNLPPWTIPNDLTQSSNLVDLKMGTANLVGSLPDIFDSFPNLQSVRLSYNNLTGTLPKSFAVSGIVNLWLDNQKNGLSGTIDVLSSMTKLSQAWLHKNKFTGSIPDLSKCKNLFDLQLRDNQLSGVVPPSLMSLSSLQRVSLDDNELQGPLPEFGKSVKVTLGGINSFCQATAGPCNALVITLLEIAAAFGYPVLLADSWKGNNPCQDWSFIVCTEGKITTVIFSKQNFQGTISPAFANLRDLRNLYLNGNNLTGSIPKSLTSLPQLVSLDVSNNNLSGEVPKFPSKVKLTATGNLFLGSVGGGSGNPSKTSNDTSLTPGWIAGIVIMAICLVVALVFVFCRCYAKHQHQKFVRVNDPQNGIGMGELVERSVSDDESQSKRSGDRSDLDVFEGGNVIIPFQAIQQVTNNFHKDNILGRGGYAVVYKGELHDGTKIAVKRMKYVAMASEGIKELQAEIAFLSKVRHKHLVAFLGYCIDGNERLLVYEYMSQGTLTQHLHEWRDHGGVPLTWKQRVAIVLDVARAVEYLHSLAQQSFIHRDLKPSNILLDDDKRAKVADFGFVKTALDGKYSVETSRVIGTLGYLAPEYAATGKVTTKVDVYAFGVILTEAITGREVLGDIMPDGSPDLVTWFHKELINKENILNAIDQTLNPDDEETMESVYKVAELAGHCTAREPDRRPDMGHAVNVLAPLVEQWKPTSHEEEDSRVIELERSLTRALERWKANEGTFTISREWDEGG